MVTSLRVSLHARSELSVGGEAALMGGDGHEVSLSRMVSPVLSALGGSEWVHPLALAVSRQQTAWVWRVGVRRLHAVSDPQKATYGYEELAARIENVLGERPSLSALRAARAEDRRTRSTLTKPRLTVGMPAPLPSPTRTSPAVFEMDEIERWLAHHPRLAWNRAVEQAQRALARGDDIDRVIAQALADRLSWRTITLLLVEHDGRVRSTAGVHKRYRHLGTPAR